MAEFDGVIQQVIENLLDFFHIRIHVQFISGEHHFDDNGFLAAGALKGNCSGAEDAVDVEIRAV